MFLKKKKRKKKKKKRLELRIIIIKIIIKNENYCLQNISFAKCKACFLLIHIKVFLRHLSVVFRYFLLLNQLWAGDSFTSYMYGSWL